MIINHRTASRFTLVEMALALAIVGIGLSAVLLLSTIGAKAGKDGRTENDLESVSNLMTVFLQAQFSAPANWRADGTSATVIPNFVASPSDADVPVGSEGFSPVSGYVGVLAKDISTYICRQSSSTDESVVDFEVMARVGVDGSFWNNQFYISPADSEAKKLSLYPRGHVFPIGTRVNGASSAAMFGKFYRPLLVEISWPIDAAWSKREKRVLRVELFNENFIPYPQN